MREDVDLNKINIIGSNRETYPLTDYSILSSNIANVIFKNIEEELVNFIATYDYIVGCVAWLTSERILNSLAKKKGVCIIVQKEDFLRPDYQDKSYKKRKEWLRKLYTKLAPTAMHRNLFFANTILGLMNASEPGILDPIRCIGFNNRQGEPSFPRCHHKFIVGCEYQEPVIQSEYYQSQNALVPEAVWTGSFNFTRAATRSFENAVILYDRDVVTAFFNEFAQIAALSEPLNWSVDILNPQWYMETDETKINFCTHCNHFGTMEITHDISSYYSEHVKYCIRCMFDSYGNKLDYCQECHQLTLVDDCKDLGEPDEGEHYYICESCWEYHKHAWGGE